MQGNAYGQYDLGFCYLTGKGVEQDQREAAKWLRKAAEQGHDDAQYNLGVSYLQGLGVTKDEHDAVKWYRKAAEQGHVHAQHSLGLCYYKGVGGEQNLREAVKWFRKAAEQGNERAKEALENIQPQIQQRLREIDGICDKKRLAEITITDPSEMIRKSAFRAMGGDVEVMLGTFIENIKHKASLDTHEMGIIGIGISLGWFAVPTLKVLINDSDPDVRPHRVESLAHN